MSFTISYVAGGVIDKVRRLPYPHFSLFEIPYIKGERMVISGAGAHERTFQLPFPTEFLSIAFATSDYCDGDYWDLYLGNVHVCETIYTKRLPESVAMGNSFGIVYPLDANVPVRFVFTNNSGEDKSVWFNIKFLREGEGGYITPTLPPELAHYNKTNVGLVAWCQNYLGNPYWFGGYGLVANQDLLDDLSSRFPTHYGSDRMATYQSHFGQQVFDCSGLIKGYLWSTDDGIFPDNASDHTANGLLAVAGEKGTMDSFPEIPGTLLHLDGHVGVYIGNGEVIEAKSFNTGVQKVNLSDTSFNQWSKLPFIEYV